METRFLINGSLNVQLQLDTLFLFISLSFLTLPSVLPPFSLHPPPFSSPSTSLSSPSPPFSSPSIYPSSPTFLLSFFPLSPPLPPLPPPLSPHHRISLSFPLFLLPFHPTLLSFPLLSYLQTAEHAKAIVAQAISHVPQSVKVWLKAVDLEMETSAKRRVLRKGESVAFAKLATTHPHPYLSSTPSSHALPPHPHLHSLHSTPSPPALPPHLT